MKIALITGGQPRFTESFIHFMRQLSGFDQADIYMAFWNSDWAQSEQEAHRKVEKILEPKYNLAKIKLVDFPSYELPPTERIHEPAKEHNVRWFYERRLGMWKSLSLAFELINHDYDMYIRFRPDGNLESTLDLNTINLVGHDLVMPSHPRHGYNWYPICDQLAIGTKHGMKVYCDLINHMNEYIPNICNYWEDNGHDWASEYLLTHHLVTINKLKIEVANYKSIICPNGRSKFTDNHKWLPIVRDPTDE
jgi:hypothetical protein